VVRPHADQRGRLGGHRRRVGRGRGRLSGGWALSRKNCIKSGGSVHRAMGRILAII
jgi:hypothetical protein